MDESAHEAFCSFFCHHNWRWVVEMAIQQMYGLSNVTVTSMNRTKHLPSYNLLQKLLKRYSLFRVEVYSQQYLSCAWTTCPAFEFLDAKDALYRHLAMQQACAVMPPTTLISYDCENEDDIPDTTFTSKNVTKPLLLKAPLGSGGDSLYFVSSKADTLAIVKAHRTKAENTPGFLDSLREQHDGSVPSWSLQTIIPSVVLSNKRKCQVRAYIIFCAAELYLYTDYEVRQPMWVKNEENDMTQAKSQHDYVSQTKTPNVENPISPTLQADIDFCAACTQGAKPYNWQRSKTHTERMMLSEVEGRLGDESTKDKITQVMLTAFRALKSTILLESVHPLAENREFLQRKSSEGYKSHGGNVNADKNDTFPALLKHTSYSQNVAEMAIIGADLIVEEGTMQPYVVEINNNPAMPAPHKTMTDKYRAHLVSFVASLISLGIDTAASMKNTEVAGDINDCDTHQRDVNTDIASITSSRESSCVETESLEQKNKCNSKLQKLRLLHID